MAPKNVIIALLALCGFAYGQTRSLLVDPSGVVQYTNTVQWQGALSFGTNEAAQAVTRSNLSLGLAALTNATGAGLLSDIGGLATNGDGSGLTNLPNANLSNAIGVLPILSGGTGSTNESAARTALGLGSAATNESSAFQPASIALTNLAAGDASGLTNLPNADLGTATGVLGIANGGSAATNAEGARTNFGLVWSGLTNTDAAGFRSALSLGTAATNDSTSFQPASTNLDALANNNGGALTNISVDLTTVLPAYSNNAGKVLAVASGETNVEWTAISNTVTDASTLTNFPAIILQTNSADGSFPAFLLRTNGDASGLTNLPAAGGASATNVGQLQLELAGTNENSFFSVGLGGAFFKNTPNMITLQSSLTNASFASYNALITAGLFVGQNSPLNFTNKFSFGAHLGVSATNFSRANFRLFVGADTNAVLADPTNTMIGFRIKDQTIYAAMHNGTSYSEPFSTNGVYDPTATAYAWCWVEGDGTGNVSWYVKGELLGATTNGPTNLAFGRYLAISATNDAGTNFTSSQPFRFVNFVYDFK